MANVELHCLDSQTRAAADSQTRAAADSQTRAAGTDVPLVLLHAFPLSSAMWEAVLPGLAADRRVLAVDLRGFGRSPLGTDPPDLSTSAGDVLAVLDRLGLSRVDLAGLSMGGYVAMRLLAGHAHRVRSLVLADTKASADAEPARQNRERIAVAVESGDHEVLHRDVLPGLLAPDVDPAVRDRAAALIDAAPAAAVAWAQRAMAVRPDSIEVLRRVRIPALIVRGSADGLATASDAEAMAAALTESRVVEIPGAGHLSAMERPGRFVASVTRFLQALGH